MGHWHHKGIGELIEDPLSYGFLGRNMLVVADCYDFVGVMAYPPADGQVSIELVPEELCGPVPGARLTSAEDLYDLLRNNRHDTSDAQCVAWTMAHFFAGSRTCRYTNRVLAWAYSVLAVRLGRREYGLHAAMVCGVMAMELVHHVINDLDLMTDAERAALQAAAPWVFDVADEMHRELPPFVCIDPDDREPWLTAEEDYKAGKQVVRKIAATITDPAEQVFALRALWPSVEDFRAKLRGPQPPIPEMGDVITLHGVDLLVVDQADQIHRFPNMLATVPLKAPGIPKLLSLVDTDAVTSIRKVTPDEWKWVLFETCRGPDWTWQISHICDLLAADEATPPPVLALFQLAHARLYAESARVKRIGKALAKALKDCTADQRNAICDRYPEASSLVRHRTKPEAVKWCADDWAVPMNAALAWGKAPEPEPQSAPKAPPVAPAVAQNSPGRISPKLQGAGQIKARAKAAPMGVAHRLLEAEWDVRADAFAELTAMTFPWLEDKLGIALTDHWREGYHEFDHHGFRLETEVLAGLMAFRIEHPDGREAGRRWRVEGTLIEPASADATGVASIRLIAIDQFKTMPAPPYSMPGIAQRWLSTGALSVMKRDPREVWILSSNPDFFLFRNTAGDAARDVGFIVTADECPDIPAQLVGTVVHVHLAPAVMGAYGKRFGGIPGPGQVHLFAANAIEPATMPFSTREQMEAAVRAAARATRLPSFGDIRQQVRASQVDLARRQSAAPAEDGSTPASAPTLNKAEQDTAALMDLAVADLDRANEELATTQELLAERDDELRQALHLIRALKLQLGEDIGPTPGEQAVPDDFEQLPEFAKRLHPRLVVAAKALRSARDADDFQDKPLVFRALRALATHYWEMRFGERDAGFTRWHEFLTENRLTFGPVGHALDNQRFSDAYQARIDGRTFPLDLHLSGSSSRNPAKCLRVYLHADEVRQRIVVGHLPSHLPNTHT